MKTPSISTALLFVVVALGTDTRTSAEPRSTPPSWTSDARWYYVNVSRFHNGDKANDAGDTLPWTADWLEGTSPANPPNVKELLRRHYGGDLQGLEQRLPYLKKLGVNALVLSCFFQGTLDGRGSGADLRHVDHFVGVKGGYSETDKETGDPATWVWTASDRVFLDFLKTAHGQGFRVVAAGFFGSFADTETKISQAETYSQSILRRWIDPNADGDPSDGVDGWIQGIEESPLRIRDDAETAAWIRTRELIKSLNPQAVIVGPGTQIGGASVEGLFDLQWGSTASVAIERFFHPESKGDATVFFKEMVSAFSGESPALNLLSVSNGPRLLTAYSEAIPVGVYKPPGGGPAPSDAAVNRWRLAIVAQHLAGGAPVTYYGDEVGMFGGASGYARAPMWWDDLPGGAARSPRHRDDFFALVEWLHRIRVKYAPFRQGALRPVFHDAEHKTLAFARTLPGDEAVVVMNYGDAKQEVTLTAGKPGQLVALMSPMLKPLPADAKRRPAKDPPDPKKLLVGGNRQFVTPEGTIVLWVDAMSARIILINDVEPRR